MKSIVESRNKEERNSSGSQQKYIWLISLLLLVSAGIASAIPTPTHAYNWNNNNFTDALLTQNGTNFNSVNSTGKVIDGRTFITTITSNVSLTGYTMPVTSMSFSIWINTNKTAGAYQGIWGTGNGVTQSYQLFIHPSGNLGIFTNNVLIDLNVSVNTSGVWQHIVLTRDNAASNRTVIWINDTVVFNNTITGGGQPLGRFQFGFGNAINGFNGTMDIPIIWEGQVLNQSDVDTLWNSGAGIEYPFTTPAGDPFSFTARDNLTGGLLTTFNASIIFQNVALNYSTTNGTIQTNITNNTNPLYDWSGNANTLTPLSTPIYDVSLQQYNFTGTQALRMNASILTNGSFTVCSEASVTSISVIAQMILTGYTSATGTTNRLRVSLTNSSFAYTLYNTTGSLPTGHSLSQSGTFSSATSYFICVGSNGTNMFSSINGNKVFSSNPLTAQVQQTQFIRFDEGAGSTANLTGTQKRGYVFSRELTQSEITSLYVDRIAPVNSTGFYPFINSSTANVSVDSSNYLNSYNTNVNVSAGSTMIANLTPYATIIASDAYDNSSLSGFVVEYNLTNYTAVGATARVPVTTEIYDAIFYNPSLYLNRTYMSVANRSQTFNASLIQTAVTFTANEIISNLSVTNFNVTPPNGVKNSSMSQVYLKPNFAPPLSAFISLNFSKFGWFAKNSNLGFSSATNTTANFKDVYSYLLNITLVNISSGSATSVFTATITSGNYAYNTTVYTTNGSLLVPWANDTNINISINASGLSNTSILWNTSNYTNVPSIVNISLRAYQANTINFIFLDEINLSVITSVNVTAFLTGTISSYNFTTPNGTYSISLINPDTYAVTYMGLGYNQRNYFYTVVNLTATNLTLYLRPTSNSSIVLINIVDQNQRSLVGATVYSRVKNLSSNSYYIVEMCQTDINGQCQISADVSTTTYKATTTYNFLVYYNNIVVGTSGDTVLSGNSLPLQVNTGSNPLVNDFALAGLVYSNVVYNNATSLYTVTYSDPATIITNFCLTAYRRIGSTTTVMNSSCSSLTANTLSIGANTSLGDENYAQATVVYNTNTYLLTTGAAQTTNTTGANYRPIFLVFVFIGVLITIFLGTKSLATTGIVLLAGITFALIRVSGNILPIVAVTGLIGMAVIIYMRLKE
jgi:hypothetical protein